MLKLIIEDDEGRKTVVPFVRDEITIGRQEGNTIRLTERNVSRRHARLLRQNGHVLVEDLGSYNGIRLNGEKIVGRAEVSDGDLVQIGDYDLAIQHEGADQAAPHAPPPPSEARNGARGGQAHLQEPVTEAASPVYEEAEPISGEEDAGSSEAELARRQSTSVIRVDQVEGGRKREVRELDPEEAPRLVVINTEFAGREFACIRTELRIGRTDDNDITLDHRSLSRTHAKLVREESGEWRILDMQSANGLQVNGEQYAQATLNHLDTVELGHLKLKFVAAGEAWVYTPGAADRPEGAGKSKVPLYAGIGAGVVVLIGLGAFLAASGGDDPPAEPPATQVAKAPPTPAPAPIKPPAPAPAPTPDPAVAAAAAAKEKMDAARQAMTDRDFSGAVALLDQARATPDLAQEVVADVDDLLGQARAELEHAATLDEAEAALEKDDLDGAQALLDKAAASAAFQERHQSLQDALARKVEARDQALAVAAAEKRPSRAERTEERDRAREDDTPETRPAAGSQGEAAKLFKEGANLFRKGKVEEAQATLMRCLKTDPAFARCHLALGATYARQKQYDKGARHYQKFLELSPNSPEAAQVRSFLKHYKESK